MAYRERSLCWTQLDGLNAVAVFVAPVNMFTDQRWRPHSTWINAQIEQVDALSKIFSGQSGGFFAAAANFIGENIGIESSQIEFGIQGKRRWLTIPEYLELEVEGIKGSDTSQDSLVTNPAFTVALGIDPAIARSMKHHYRDHGFELDSSGKNGFYSEFKYGP